VDVGNVGAVTGKVPLVCVLDQRPAERAGARTLLCIVAVENDGTGVDERARGCAGQTAIVVEASSVEQLATPPIEIEKLCGLHRHHQRTLDMSASAAEP